MDIIEDQANELQDKIFKIIKHQSPRIACTVLIKMLIVGSQVNKIKKEDFLKELSSSWDFYEKA